MFLYCWIVFLDSVCHVVAICCRLLPWNLQRLIGHGGNSFINVQVKYIHTGETDPLTNALPTKAKCWLSVLCIFTCSFPEFHWVASSSRQGPCPDCIFVLYRHSFWEEEDVNTSKGKGVNFSKSLLVSFPKWLLSLRDTQTSVSLCHLRKCIFRYHWGFYFIKFKYISLLRYFFHTELNKSHSFSCCMQHSHHHVSDFLWKHRIVGSIFVSTETKYSSAAGARLEKC